MKPKGYKNISFELCKGSHGLRFTNFDEVLP